MAIETDYEWVENYVYAVLKIFELYDYGVMQYDPARVKMVSLYTI